MTFNPKKHKSQRRKRNPLPYSKIEWISFIRKSRAGVEYKNYYAKLIKI